MVILATWCRTLGIPPHKFRDFLVWGNHIHKRCQVQTSYGHGGSNTLKRTSNCIFYQVEELIQGDLGYLLQEFGSFPTQISRFFGLGEPYRQTVPATDQLWPWGFLHIKEDVKLYILSGGEAFPWSSWLYGAGDWEFSHTNFEIFWFGGTI